jgi:hypothetical protein
MRLHAASLVDQRCQWLRLRLLKTSNKVLKTTSGVLRLLPLHMLVLMSSLLGLLMLHPLVLRLLYLLLRLLLQPIKPAKVCVEGSHSHQVVVPVIHFLDARQDIGN